MNIIYKASTTFMVELFVTRIFCIPISLNITEMVSHFRTSQEISKFLNFLKKDIYSKHPSTEVINVKQKSYGNLT